MIYRSIEDLTKIVTLELQSNNFDACLKHVESFVFNIIDNSYMNGILIDIPGLDDLCLNVGKSFLIKKSFKPASVQTVKNRIIYIATELYNTGGHTAVIEDFIDATLDKEHIILLTNSFNNADISIIQKRFSDKAQIISSNNQTLSEKLLWLFDTWNQLAPEKVYLFNHQHDSVAIAACQSQMPGQLYFYHHADYQLTLGLRIPQAIHIDFRECLSSYCQQKNYSSSYLYLPITASGHGVRNSNHFLQNKKLRTCTSGGYNKFISPYLYDYAEIISNVLKITQGTHVHIGFLDKEYLNKIYNYLHNNNLNEDKFIYIPHVDSIWIAMKEYEVDIYLTSFILGGGKTGIEVMGSGTPIISHHNYRSSLLNASALLYPEVFTWSHPDELYNIFASLNLDVLEQHRQYARKYYENNFSKKAFQERLFSETKIISQLTHKNLIIDNSQLYIDLNNNMLAMKLVLKSKDSKIIKLIYECEAIKFKLKNIYFYLRRKINKALRY